MRGTKRHALTTDELMRMQEQPARKKFKPYPAIPDDSDAESLADGCGSASHSRSGGSSESEGSDGDEENDGEADEGSGEDSEDAESSQGKKLAVDPYGIFALVLTPTRELAFQISEQFAVLGSALSLRTAVVVGGMDMMAQAIELGHRPHVVVATPGRIVDLLKSCSGEWDLSRIKFLVLDEADRLLTPTFAPELSYLFETLPRERQTCLFTATLTPAVETLANAPPRPGKQKPFIHRMTESVETVETLQQHYILVPSQVRESYLFYLLCNPPESTIHLRRAPPESVKPSKNHPAHPRDRTALAPHPTRAAQLALALALPRERRARARVDGRRRAWLDIEDVALVVNWDMPDEPEEYTHRVGRTARKGKGGVAVSFVTERDEERVVKVEERIRTKLTEMALPEGKVLENLNVVSTAKRLANMVRTFRVLLFGTINSRTSAATQELHDSDFGKREEIHKIKRAKRRADVEASRAE
ncbi:hypothetical protein EVJ58_g4374 [Rhodofomes roseus]|uniref:Uncharacterized protein n=1 Tax=Rhodofomes roseus TaxID=34475 RepID=A0A4Y9YJM5_9APHY|nr:hypothetical protein EVJ58_g4374 [Rhodofomes roseus]